jgi:signal peptidase II
MLWGPFARYGLTVAIATIAVDQASKLWLLYASDIATAPWRSSFLDLVLVWNKGISYGLFQQRGAAGQWILLAVEAVAVGLLWIWLARASSRLTAIALGLIIGGAIGNAIDRAVHDAVADFLLFHVTTESFQFSWYVFNLADAAIVAGVAGLLYESVLGDGAAKAPRSP